MDIWAISVVRMCYSDILYMSFGGHMHALLLVIYLGMKEEDSQRGKLTPHFCIYISGFPSPDLRGLILHF